MSAVARALDDLDRLAFRLSRTIRTQYPQLLTQGFTLSDLEERLLPYRDVRREMADGGTDAFETTLLRLIAGDRGYLLADPELQGACRQALAFPSPTLAMVRAWATSPLRLSTVGGSGGRSGAVAAVSGSSAAWGTGPRHGDRVSEYRSAEPRTVDLHHAEHDLFPPPSRHPEPSVRGPATASAAPAAHHCCRYCANTLPQGRAVTFCPHCGMDLTKRRCPACSTELDVEWTFCVTCGRKD